MAESGESTDSAKIDARNAQKPTITQLMMDKRKFFDPSLNVNFPKVKLGLPVKLGIRVGTVSCIAGFACGYITAASQQDLIKTVVQKSVEDSQVIKNVVHKALEEYKVEFIKNVVHKALEEYKVEFIKNEVRKALEEYKVEFIKSALEKMLEENNAIEKNKIEKKRN